MSRQRIVSNVLVMAVGHVGTWGISLLYFVLIGRYLGPARFGELALAKSIIAVLWLGATLGMETMIARAVARTPQRAAVLSSAAMATRIGMAAPVLAALYVFVHLAHLNTEVATAAYLYGAAAVVWSLQGVLLATFQGREQMSLNTMWTIARNAVELCLALVVIWRHGSVVAFAATDIPTAILLLAVTLRWMQRFGGLTWRVSRRDLREVVKGGLAFWANDVFYSFYLYIDSIILAGMAGTRAVGFYAPATQLFTVPMFLTGIIGSATLPQLSRLGVDRGEDFKRAVRKVFSLYIVAGVPVTIGLVTFAGPLTFALYGPAYRPSVPALVVLSLAIVPVFLNYQFSQTLAASDRQWWWAAALGGASIVNPLLNVMLIPIAQHTWHNAAVGAALAWLLTEILEVIYGIVLLPDIVLDRVLARALIGALVAGAAQVAALWTVGAVWLPMGEAIGVAAYAAVAVALGTVAREDVALLTDTILRRTRGRRAQAHVAEVK